MREDALTAIQTISRRARLLLAVLALAAIAGAVWLVWQMIFDMQGFTRDLKSWLGADAHPITLSGRALTGLVMLALVNAGIAAAALLAAWRLFDLFGKGRVFSRRCGELLRLAGAITLAGAVSTVLSRTLAMLIATYDNPPGERILLISFGSSEGMLLLVSALLYAMGHVIALAADIERENRSFV